MVDHFPSLDIFVTDSIPGMFTRYCLMLLGSITKTEFSFTLVKWVDHIYSIML